MIRRCSKRDKGECFRYDEKWFLAHICTKKELNVIMLDDDNEKILKAQMERE